MKDWHFVPPLAPATAAILPGAGALKPAVGTTVLIVTASLVALALNYVMGVERVAVVFAVAVMGVAALYGVKHGVLAALCCVVTFNFFVGTPPFSLQLDARQDAANAIMFAAAAWLAGTYTEVLRERRDGVRALYEGVNVAGRTWGLDKLRDRSPGHWLAWEALRLSAALAVAGAFVAAGVHLRPQGVEQVSLIFFAGVIACALLFGARYAIVAAVLTALALNIFVSSEPLELDLSDPQQAVNLAILAGCAWWIGNYADRVRSERAAIRLVLSAGEQLAQASSEEELRHLLCDIVSGAGGDVPTVVVGPDGKVLASRLVDEPPASAIKAGLEGAAHQTFRVGPWRVRRMDAGGDALGAVIWRRGYRQTSNARALDSTIGSFVDRCGGALAQMRLMATRAEGEVRMRTERLRNALLASVSHDFRTPLAGILGASTSLLEFPTHNAEVAREMLSTIKSQAQRLNRYMENLIGAARLEDGALNVKLAPCVVWDLVADVWEDFAESSAIRLFDLQGAADAIAIADPVMLRQALANVLENALKFSPPDSTITARVLIGLTTIVVDIADEGPGVPPEQLERIFERFYRSPDATISGTGLGLYICRILVEAQQGQIEALARPDGRRGLLVRIVLPMAPGVSI